MTYSKIVLQIYFVILNNIQSQIIEWFTITKFIFLIEMFDEA